MNQFFIDINNQQEFIEMVLYDVNRKKIYKHQNSEQQGENEIHTINTSSIESGIYFLHLSFENERVTKRLSIVH